MNSVMRFIVWGTIPLGALAGGRLGTWLGLRETIVIGAIGGGLSFLWILFSPQRHLREMPEPIDDAEPEPTRGPACRAPSSGRARRPLAARRLPAALGRRRRSASSGRRSRCSRFRSPRSSSSTRARSRSRSSDGRVPPVPALRTSRRACGWTASSRKPILVPGTRAARCCSARSRSPTLRRAHDLAAVRRRLLRRGLHGLLDVAYQSYLPSLVDRDRPRRGQSKLELSRSAAQLAGPGLRGRAHRRDHGAVRDPAGRDQLRRHRRRLVVRIRRAEEVPEPTEPPSMRRRSPKGFGTSSATGSSGRSR